MFPTRQKKNNNHTLSDVKSLFYQTKLSVP